MDTINLLQQIATTPRYGQHFSQLIASQPETIQHALMQNDSTVFANQAWEEGGFQATTNIIVDLR